MPEKSAEEYLGRALEALFHRLMVISPDYRILAASGNAVDDASGLLGKSCFEAVFSLDAPCRDCALPEVLATKEAVMRRPPRAVPDSRTACRRFLPLTGRGRVEAVAVTDMTPERMAVESAEMSSANAFLKNLLMSSVDGIIASNMHGGILIFNEAASQITGYSQEEALTTLDIRDIYPDDGAREVMRRLRAEEFGGAGKLKSFRTELLRKDGSTVPIDLSAAIVYEDDQEAATVGFFYDLRPKITMEKELHATQVQLMQAEKMSSMGKLAAGVAHQLNNPLGGVIIFAQLMLEDYDLPPRAREDLLRIISDAERCQEIVKELLDFARQSNLDIRPVDINRALDRTIFLLQNQPLFRKVEIRRNYDQSLPSVPCDLQQLNHVFMNIILNAADAMQGLGVLSVTTRLAPGGQRVCVEISDTGPGIPGDVLPRIFDPFYTTKEEGQGTGLGLSVAYGVMENHKGRITACSAPGEGATFVIELPLTRSEGGGGDDDG